DTQGVWRKLVQMLSGEPVVVRGVEVATLRPPLEDLPAEHEVALPLRIDWLPTHEDNCRVYRLLAAVLAGRREFGTYAHPDLRARVCAPELLEDLFLLAEGVRVHHRLATSYPGLAGEARALGTRLLEGWGREPAPSRTLVLDALLLLALGARPRPGGAKRRPSDPQPPGSPPRATTGRRAAIPSLPTSCAGSSRRARRSGREAA